MRISSVSALALALPGPALAFHHRRSMQMRDSADTFDWDSITPSRNLEYHECYGKLRCARLKVPMDWSGKESNSSEWVAIAIASLPATVPEDDESFGGTVLINPGGPGGSGTQQAIEGGEVFQGIVDGEGKHYEILGFDPRGMAFSTPRADCYNNTLDRAAHTLNVESIPPLAVPGKGIQYFQGLSEAENKLCDGSDASSILGHVSTASVARDMLEIAEKVDELRLGKSYPGPGKAKVQYFGVSYGTFLGNTFASMFPGRVGRVILDGVVNPEAFIDGAYRDTLNDAEEVLYHFYETCFKAGEDCLLRADGDKSAQDIKKRVDTLLAFLDESPATVVVQGRGRLVTSYLVRDTIRSALYSPIAQYEALSQILAAAVAGQWDVFMTNSPLAQTYSVAPQTNDVCEAEVDPTAYEWYQDAAKAVLCGDSLATVGDRNLTWAQGVVDYLYKQAPSVYDGWARNMLLCSGWSIEPDYAFAGPFGTHKDKGGCKAPPILLLSTRHDHATPLANAIKVSESFEGSGLVIQESYGHTTVYTSPSNCTAKVVSHYMATGEVPDERVICQPDCEPSIPAKACPGIPAA